MKLVQLMNRNMGGIRKLIFGPKDGDIEALKDKYGRSPSEFISLPNGVQVHLRDEGDTEAPVIVLVHGHSEDLHTWNNLAKHLISDFRVIRFDLRRHGLTGPSPDKEYKLENYVSDLSMLISHLGLDSFIIVGHSMGGRISLKYTIENSDKVAGMVLISASGAPNVEKSSPPMALRMMKNPLGRAIIKRVWSRKMAKSSLQDMVFEKSIITDEEIDRLWDLSRYPGSMDAMFREFAIPWQDFTSDEIGDVAVQTLLIWGNEDTICPRTKGDWYHLNLPNSTIVGLTSIGHNPQLECPRRCYEEILSWTEKLDGNNNS